MVTLVRVVSIADVVHQSLENETRINFGWRIILEFAGQRTGIGFNVNITR